MLRSTRGCVAMSARLDPELRRLIERATSTAQFDVPLDQFSHWRVGGCAAAVVEPTSTLELQTVRRILNDYTAPSLVIGATSNLLFDSAGYGGVLIRIGAAMAGMVISGRDVSVQAGTSVPELARATADAGLAGLEHIVGIPGTIGGLAVMNGGSQRKYIGANLVEITAVDRSGGLRVVDSESLELGYRTSGLESLDLALVSVHLRLDETDEPIAIHERMDAIVAARAAKFPLDLPSCGSTFLSDPSMYATIGTPGQAIEDAGIKGLSHGGAQISVRHANFIVNHGGATSDDVLWLIRVAQESVRSRTGYTMACEARFVGEAGDVMPADVAARLRWPDQGGR